MPSSNYCDTAADALPSNSTSVEIYVFIIRETVTGDNSSTHFRTCIAACSNKVPTACCLPFCCE